MPSGHYVGLLGLYYCAFVADKAFGRDIVDAHYKACLYAGLSIGGANGEIMPGQWESQISLTVGVGAGDQLWVARYILERITESCGVIVSFDPKPKDEYFATTTDDGFFSIIVERRKSLRDVGARVLSYEEETNLWRNQAMEKKKMEFAEPHLDSIPISTAFFIPFDLISDIYFASVVSYPPPPHIIVPKIINCRHTRFEDSDGSRLSKGVIICEELSAADGGKCS
ncbi:hypothetical protein Bca101_043859 [Brassica carinata]